MSNDATRMYSTCFSLESAGYCGRILRFRFLTKLDCFEGAEADEFERLAVPLIKPTGVLRGGTAGAFSVSNEPFDRYEATDANEGLRPPEVAVMVPLVDGLYGSTEAML